MLCWKIKYDDDDDADLRLEMQFRAFRRQLKTVLFSEQKPRRILIFCFFRAPYKYSYLLTYLLHLTSYEDYMILLKLQIMMLQ